MFKNCIKLLLLTMIVLSAGLLLSSGGKVYADTGCPAQPNAFDNAQNNHNWGVDPQYNGNHGGAMAGMIIHAYDANTKQDLSMHYHINSQIYADDPHPGTAPNGQPIANLNAAIYIDISGNFSNRVTERQGQTGGLLYDGGTDSTFNCAGWDAYGPADVWGGKSRVGNAYVLDCGPQGNPTKFWFSNMSNPLDDNTNKNNGYWSVQVIYGQNHDQVLDIPHYTEGSMSYLNSHFNVWNGGNTYVNFAWHPDPPNTQPPPSSGTGSCQNLTLHDNSGSSLQRVWATVTGVTVGKIQYIDDKGNVSWFPGPSGNDNYGDPGKPGRPPDIAAWVGGGGASGDKNKNLTKQWWFQPSANDIQVTYRVDSFSGGSGGSWTNGTTYYLDSAGNWQTNPSTVVHCFSANCNNPLTVVGDVPGGNGAVLANGSIYVSGSYTNTGLLDLWYPALIGSDGQTHQIAGIAQPLTPGQTVAFSFEMQAPPGAQNYALTLTPSYNPGTIGNVCSATVPTYEEFTASAVPWSQLQPTKEDPTSADYFGKIDIKLTSHAIQFPSGTTAALYKKPAPGGGGQTTLVGPASDGTHSQGSPYLLGSATSNHSPISGVNAGDQFCTDMTVTPTHGFVGPSNNIIVPTGSDTQSSCDKVVNQPYVHFFGSDVRAGGGFTDSCHADQRGNIFTYSKLPGAVGGGPIAGTGGSSTQFGAQAMNIISGLGSANQRTVDPKGPDGLIFANKDSNIPAGATAPGGITGGFLNPPPISDTGNFCMPDYFSKIPNPAPPIDPSPTAQAGAGAAVQHYQPPTGTALTLTGTPSGPSGGIGSGPIHNYAIFVDGDVTIKGDIKYSTSPRTSVGQIPSFFLVVKGNIHIDPGVTQLDGMYIAQPDPAKPSSDTSIINTCWNPSLITTANDIYANCKYQLVVNGAFVANKIFLTRSYSSLRYSQNGEYYVPITNPTQPQHSCGNVNYDVPTPSTASAADCAAEVFMFNPESYLSQPSLTPKSTGKFDSITSLPPVL